MVGWVGAVSISNNDVLLLLVEGEGRLFFLYKSEYLEERRRRRRRRRRRTIRKKEEIPPRKKKKEHRGVVDVRCVCDRQKIHVTGQVHHARTVSSFWNLHVVVGIPVQISTLPVPFGTFMVRFGLGFDPQQPSIVVIRAQPIVVAPKDHQLTAAKKGRAFTQHCVLAHMQKSQKSKRTSGEDPFEYTKHNHTTTQPHNHPTTQLPP